MSSLVKCVNLSVTNPCGSEDFPYGHAMTLLQGMKYVDRLERHEGAEVEEVNEFGQVILLWHIEDSDYDLYEFEIEAGIMSPYRTIVVSFPPQYAQRLADRHCQRLVSV